MFVCMGARIRSRSHGPVVHPAGHRLPRAARGNHICSVTKLRILHTGLIAAAVVTYLTFRQVARVELKCAPQTVFGIFAVMLPRGYVYEVVAVARRITAEFILFNSLYLHIIRGIFILPKGTNHRARETVSKCSRSEKC